MKLWTALLFIIAGSASAETITLACEHDGGVNRADGRPSNMEFNFFQIEVDTDKNEIRLPNPDLKAKQVMIERHVISFLVDIEYPFVSRRIWISRYTGKLYVNQFGIKDEKPIDIIASGTCQKPTPLF